MKLSRRAFTLAAAVLPAVPAFAQRMSRIGYDGCGLDRLAHNGFLAGRDNAYALLTHAGAVDRRGLRSADVVASLLGPKLVALLSPEHGLAGRAAAGEAVGDGRDAATGLPVYSLYGARREPPAELLGRIDTLIVDLQDVGLRPFTYAATMTDCLRAAAQHGVRVLVLDRPNPLGGETIDGPRPDPSLTSPVAALPIAFRHGLTIGELARLARDHFQLETRLDVITCRFWMRFDDTSIYRGEQPTPFVAPSPNLRSPDAVLAYAATVLIEGTNLSEGRGTARPFETIGAPWCQGAALARAMSALGLPGVSFARQRFTPTTSKHAGARCDGLRFEVRDETAYDPLLTGLSLIAEARRLHPDSFAFLGGERPFFDLLIGQSSVRAALLAGDSPAAIVARWRDDLAAFDAERQKYLLYPALPLVRSP